MELNKFVEWQKEHKNCAVSIEIGKEPRTNEIKIWVYDYDLTAGQYVTSVDEINLQSKKDNEDRAIYEELKKKFEGDANA